MKKTLSVFLAALLVACSFLPAFAADGTYEVRFIAPSPDLEDDAYTYYKSAGGVFAEYEEDPDGGYGYYSGDGQYYFIDDLTDRSREVFDNAAPGSPESYRYSPVKCSNGTVEAGKTVSFLVLTSEKYDVKTVTVLCNGEVLEKNANGEYAVTADRNLTFSVQERDENNIPILLRNHFVVTMASGDGYAAKPLQGENNKVAYYGDSFKFRVKITKGFNGDNMKVKVIRGESLLAEYLGEEADMLSSILDKEPPLASIGVDSDGYRIYEITDVTSDCKVMISGVNKDSSSGILAMLKRILRLLLSLLGINLDDLLGEENNPLAAYTVSLNDNVSAIGVTYSTSPEFKFNSSSGKYEADILNGECITIIVTKNNESQPVSVSWKYTDENGELKEVNDYDVNWVAYYDISTQKTTYSAIWYVDGITQNREITIAAN